MRVLETVIGMLLVLPAAQVVAKLPPLTPEQQAAADRAKVKSAHDAQVAAYQLCQVENRVAAVYLSQQKAKGKVYEPSATPPCVLPQPLAK